MKSMSVKPVLEKPLMRTLKKKVLADYRNAKFNSSEYVNISLNSEEVKRYKRNIPFKTIALLVVVSTLLSCVSVPKRGLRDSWIVHPYYSTRKFAPEPVYNRVGLAYLPAPLPKDKSIELSQTLILPKISLIARNNTIEEIGTALSDATEYRFNAPSHILNKKVYIAINGTIEEIAKVLAEKTGFTVEVNHDAKQFKIF
jgi:hypothetical protein